MTAAMGWRRTLLAALLSIIGPTTAMAAEPAVTRSHGVSVFGDLKYKADFSHFDYVNPTAPKGGAIRLAAIDSFDNLNPYILKGAKEGSMGLTFATLMTRANDEPDALYGYVAESVTLPADRRWVEVTLRPEARFHDGSAITAADVAFTFDTLITKGHPRYRILFATVAKAEIKGPRRVRFNFKAGNTRDLPTQLAALPVLSRAYYAKRRFDKTTLTAPLGSGPYKVAKVEGGRFIAYRRIADHWAAHLPVMQGRFNFDTIRIDYFRDRDIAFEALFAGAYDFREEFTSRSWATQYNKPAVRDGRIVREILNDQNPSGLQAFFFNTRREKFSDRRVRAALDLAFDFEWTNKNLFYGAYKRTNSMFANSELAADGPPDATELKLLEPLRGQVPDAVFNKPFRAPQTDGSGRNRVNLRKAAKLLRQAGYKVIDNRLVDAKGKKFVIEFLLFESSFQRIINPYIRNLRRIGVEASIRIVDVANFIRRQQQYDFDVVVERYSQLLTPGVEQNIYYGSKAADTPGMRNLAGIKNPAVDHLIAKVMGAKSRPELVAATRAIDRVLMWNRYVVPQWYKGAHTIAYWNKFSRPAVKPRYDLGLLDTWWYSGRKAAMIKAGKAPPKPPKALP
ncbi:MAG: extracellular solute-binding protein [Alphaproteobacteria bacterium]